MESGEETGYDREDPADYAGFMAGRISSADLPCCGRDGLWNMESFSGTGETGAESSFDCSGRGDCVGSSGNRI